MSEYAKSRAANWTLKSARQGTMIVVIKLVTKKQKHHLINY